MKFFVACLIITTLLMMPALAADSAFDTDFENTGDLEDFEEEWVDPPESLTTVYLDSYFDRIVKSATKTIKEETTDLLGDNTPDFLLAPNEPDWNSSTWVKETLTYTIFGGECRVSVYNGSETDLLVPATTNIDGTLYRTVLNGSVFVNRPDLRNISFENGVYAYNLNRAFSNLTNVSIDFTNLNFSNLSNAENMFSNSTIPNDLTLNISSNYRYTVNLNYSFRDCSVDGDVYFKINSVNFTSFRYGFNNLVANNVTFTTNVPNGTNVQNMSDGIKSKRLIIKDSYLGLPFTTNSIRFLPVESSTIVGFEIINTTFLSNKSTGTSYVLVNCPNLRIVNLSGLNSPDYSLGSNQLVGSAEHVLIYLPASGSLKIQNGLPMRLWAIKTDTQTQYIETTEMYRDGIQTSAYNITYNTDNGTIDDPLPHYGFMLEQTLPSNVTKPGYRFVGWYDNPDFSGSPITTIDNETYGDLTLYALYTPVYNVSIAPTVGGNVTSNVSTAEPDDIIGLTVTPDADYFLNSLSVETDEGDQVTVDMANLTFVMPSDNVTISAEFKPIPRTVSVVQPDFGGTISTNVSEAVVGESVLMVASPQDGYELESWIVEDDNGTAVQTTGNTFVMPAENVTVTATFSLIDYDIIAYAMPAGSGSVSVNSSANYGETVNVSATPQTGYGFDSWSVITSGGQSVSVSGNPSNFEMPADNVSVVANFVLVPFDVSLSQTTGGTISSNVSEQTMGSAVQISATPDEGYVFISWSVETEGGQPISVSGNPATFTMPADNVTVSATFDRILYSVRITQPSSGGFISSDVSGSYVGDVVNVSATIDTGYEFVAWSVITDGGQSVSVSGNASGSFTMPADNVTVSATLRKTVYNIVIDHVTEGSVNANVSTATYGDTVRIVASPVAGYNFESWTVTTDGGQTVSVTGSDNATFSMPADNVTVRGNFVAGLFVSTVVQTVGGSVVVTPATAVPGTTISIISQPDSGYLNGGYNVRSDAGYEILVTNGTYSMPASNVFVQTNFVPISTTFTTLPGTAFTPNSIVLNYTTNARIDDNPTIVWQASDDGFETIGENGTVSGGNGSIVFSTNKTGNMTVRMRPDVGSEWVSIDISISSEVVISICDGVDGSRISTGTPYTSIPGLVTPQGALVNSILNNSTLTITTSNGTTRMTSWMTSINAAAGENITFSYAGSSDSFWDNISWTLTVPTNREMNISLPRKTDGYAGTVLYYTDGGIGIPGLQVSVFDSSYQSLGNITTYAGGQAVFSSESLAAVYFNVNVSGYDENTKVVGIPSSDSVYLAKTRDITIKVLDSMGGEFVSAFTTYLGPDQIMKSTDNGTVSYSGVIDGTYDVMISASGFNQVTRPITVSEFETSFVLQVSQSNTTTYQSPNNVRLIYTDVFGKKIRNLTITVSENNTTIFTGQTGSDGAVALTMNQTKLYTIRAFDISGKEVNSLTLWPQYNEYSIIVKSSDEIESETGLNNVSYKTKTESVNATTTSLNVSMKNENKDQNVTYITTLTLGNSTKNFTTGTISANSTTNTTFYLPNANESYLLTISFTDEHNVQKTVTTTIRTDYNELKSKYSLPGFTEQWHYDALCVLIILVTAFLFSQQTKHIGGLLIPLEFAGLYAIGWMRFSAFAMCLCVAGAIMALIMFVEKMDRD